MFSIEIQFYFYGLSESSLQKLYDFEKIPCFCGHLQQKNAPICPWCFAPTLHYFAWVHKTRPNAKQSSSHINWILIAVLWLPGVPVTYWPIHFICSYCATYKILLLNMNSFLLLSNLDGNILRFYWTCRSSRILR